MIESIEVGRKEDGNRSIADKITKRLHDLDKTVENNHPQKTSRHHLAQNRLC